MVKARSNTCACCHVQSTEFIERTLLTHKYGLNNIPSLSRGQTLKPYSVVTVKRFALREVHRVYQAAYTSSDFFYIKASIINMLVPNVYEEIKLMYASL